MNRNTYCLVYSRLRGMVVAVAESATVESKTNFVRAAPVRTCVVGETTPIYKGRRTMLWQTKISTPQGKLVALITQTQLILRSDSSSAAAYRSRASCTSSSAVITAIQAPGIGRSGMSTKVWPSPGRYLSG
ncbi:ESPR-type extended signal peptide-containing protein [Pandoraea sp.]|uniref:PaaI family thioesterase n=1 Tax=Pandoraea sp. TaxID=1883445 RepID=UPI00344D3C93